MTAEDVHVSTRASSHVVGFALAVVGAIGFSAKAVVVKLAYQHGVDATTVVAYRMIFALPFFLLLGWWSSRGVAPLRPRDWAVVAVLGLFGGYLTSVLDFEGLKYISAGLERLIVYLTPTVVLAISVLFFKQLFRWRQVVALAVSYGGVVLVIAPETLMASSSVELGAALVFGSAVTYAIYLTCSGRVVGRVGAARLASYGTSVACFLCIVHFLVLKPVSALVVAPEVLWLSLINGVACTFLPVVMVMMAIARIGAPLASQCGMAGPISTITLGAIFLGEPVTSLLMTGTVLVVAGIWLLATAVQTPGDPPRRAVERSNSATSSEPCGRSAN
jgi:drug/metabolite transporter (DMT)-like permease